MKKDSFSDVVIETITLVIVSIVRAAIAWWLWGLIAVPIFGLPALTLLEIYCLAWLIRLFFPYSYKRN